MLVALLYLFYLISFHFSLLLQRALQVLVGLPQGALQAPYFSPPRGWWPCYFILFYFILICFYNTHQVLGGLLQGVGGLASLFYFVVFYFILDYFITRTRCSWGSPKGLVALLFLLLFLLYLIQFKFIFIPHTRCS
jgi:hypothetical protein